MLVSAMLRAAGRTVATGGNTGTPALALLERAAPDYYVLELSSFQLEATHALRPAAAAVLNISADHMDRYRGLPDYIAAKARLYRQAAAAVVNADDPASPRPPAGVPVVTFSLGEPQSERDFGVAGAAGAPALARGGTALAKVAELALQGEHNVANMLAAMALVSAAGVELTGAALTAGLRCRGLPHRCELVAEVSGVRWINDSKGTNVGAAAAALTGLDRPIIWIAGGQGKGADFSPLAGAVRRSVRHTILFGEDAAAIAGALDDDASYIVAASLEQAVAEAAARARAGDAVLFSPACASFDMFDDYAHRGREFKRLVRERVS